MVPGCDYWLRIWFTSLFIPAIKTKQYDYANYTILHCICNQWSYCIALFSFSFLAQTIIDVMGYFDEINMRECSKFVSENWTQRKKKAITRSLKVIFHKNDDSVSAISQEKHNSFQMGSFFCPSWNYSISVIRSKTFWYVF